ncbi:hypothetical protein HLH33_17190 [Gluconacetobacter diazotrophicus]|uniref:Uncharacterized protein n=1 Tax=Gluconacetobacter diazotrophicus TaxID=33996 RepID=A0A7W4NML7_GLUDI|nr:hypothetical protein [Gluconacetobacter diazotrophicus]MBB2158008.1 hypothetical protein [Gluconacetobacter diazotrophicus]
MTDNQMTARGWLRHAAIGALSGAVGSVLTLLAISGHMAPRQLRPAMVAPVSSESMFEIAEKAHSELADRMANAIVKGIEHE